MEARWAAGAMTGEQARRLWHLLPLAVQGAGQELARTWSTSLCPAYLCSARGGFRAAGPRPAWLTQLENLVARKADCSGIPNLQQSALFEQYTQVLRALASKKPLLLALDDLQWADGGSVSLLFHLGRQMAGSRMLIVGAYRPEEVAMGARLG